MTASVLSARPRLFILSDMKPLLAPVAISRPQTPADMAGQGAAAVISLAVTATRDASPAGVFRLAHQASPKTRLVLASLLPLERAKTDCSPFWIG